MRWFEQEAADGIAYAVCAGGKRTGEETLLAAAVTTRAEGKSPQAIGAARDRSALAAGYDRLQAKHACWWAESWRWLNDLQSDRPDLVQTAVGRMVTAWNTELDQFIAHNLLSADASNTRIGSGGYGYTRSLPNPGGGVIGMHTQQMWGCSNAQIFSEVSPEMHWEFALKHDFPWLSCWGLTYYGCCEPLDFKMDLLHRIPNLRDISMNYRIKVNRAVQNVADRYVFSYKPNPAVFATGDWHPDEARRELTTVLERARGCHVEFIMKDISTVRYQPQRLWDWARSAMEVAEESGGC